MSSRFQLLVVDADQGFVSELTHALAVDGFLVRGAGDIASARRLLTDISPDAVVVDHRLPDGFGLDLVRELRHRDDPPIVLMTALLPDTRMIVDAVRHGALDVLEKPVFPQRLTTVLMPALEDQRATRRGARRPAAAAALARPPIIGDSPVLRTVLDQVARVAATPSTTVLVHGESGTGKELVARAIHFDGRRASCPFMAINCAALNESILEAELFGYEKGAFTGASAQGKHGLLEAADGGTLFLDEIGEMSPALQAKLLRFLQESSFKRVGGVKDIVVDVRVIAATNRELWEDVQSGTFRKDLFFRLNVMPIRAPSLRERRDDVPVLAAHFLARFAADLRKPVSAFSEAALQALSEHEWPGNVRELRNVCEYAVIVCDGTTVEPRHLSLTESESATAPTAAAMAGEQGALPLRDRSLRSVEEDLIRLVLGETRFNITRAARLLGINRSTLYHKMKSFGLEATERPLLRQSV